MGFVTTQQRFQHIDGFMVPFVINKWGKQSAPAVQTGNNVAPSPSILSISLAPPTGPRSNPISSQGGARGEDQIQLTPPQDLAFGSRDACYYMPNLGAKSKAAFEIKTKSEKCSCPQSRDQSHDREWSNSWQTWICQWCKNNNHFTSIQCLKCKQYHPRPRNTSLSTQNNRKQSYRGHQNY